MNLFFLMPDSGYQSSVAGAWLICSFFEVIDEFIASQALFLGAALPIRYVMFQAAITPVCIFEMQEEFY